MATFIASCYISAITLIYVAFPCMYVCTIALTECFDDVKQTYYRHGKDPLGYKLNVCSFNPIEVLTNTFALPCPKVLIM